MQENESPRLSIVLNVMGRLELADYGFRAWMLQDIAEPYEVVLNLFNDQRARYEKLSEGRVPQCRVVIREYEKPRFFNISAANNLGLHAASGQYVLFANADMIYPGQFARDALAEFADRKFHYCVFSRVDLTQSELALLRPPMEFRTPTDFDVVTKLKGDKYWPNQGWLASREAIRAIGGFDPRILVAEDRDVWDRILHYLRRKNMQRSIVSSLTLTGFHLYHEVHELFHMFDPAAAILDARGSKLNDQPDSEEDIVPTRLDDLNALLDDLRKTEKPPAGAKYRRNVLKKVARRFTAAYKAFRGIG